MHRLTSVLFKVLGVDPASVTEETAPEDVETWDSFNGLLLVSELEQTFQVKFTMDEVVAVKNVGDIKEVLRRHGVVLEEGSYAP